MRQRTSQFFRFILISQYRQHFNILRGFIKPNCNRRRIQHVNEQYELVIEELSRRACIRSEQGLIASEDNYVAAIEILQQLLGGGNVKINSRR
jgi:hypothetical protein